MCITRNAMYNADPQTGRTALSWAAGAGHTITVVALVAAGADPNLCGKVRVVVRSAGIMKQKYQIELLFANRCNA
jgi:ankyrin repeat protein